MEEIMNQLGMYVRLEKQLTENRIVAILAETEGDGVYVWYGQSVIIDETHRQKVETKLKLFAEYENICFGYVNNKLKVVNSISDLNKMLDADGIDEKLRSQFVGTC